MKGKRDPWLRLARLTFGERKPLDDPEMKQLRHQIDVGYAKTGRRRRAKTARDLERALLIKTFGMERLMKGPLSKVFLNACTKELLENKFTPPKGGQWTHDAVRLLIKELRKPAVAPRPFHEPAPEDGDM